MTFSKTQLALVLLCGALASPVLWADADHSAADHSMHSQPEQMRWGIAGDSSQVSRTIDVRMGDDMRFKPGTLTFKKGETIRLILHNDGKLMHEYVLGTKETLDEHAQMMLKHPGMEHHAAYMAHVAPGQSGEIIWTFNQAGRFDFACLIAGHYQAGMVGSIEVSP
ncbi:cupredoxin domain-containing protein [Pseudomonas sp. S9]|uniref:cupredoxin domain-containing protein n=1 Tax=Pseudomonas sp. S9 TaxID=686578 RepID=UPI0002556CF5|nr:cupredoxin family protein [Pseudomonas sp. S9]